MAQKSDIPKYKYYIQVNGGTEYRLDYAPDGFLDEFVLKRNASFKGMFKTYSDKTIKFAKDGRNFLVDAIETLGINAEIAFRVERINKSYTYDTIFNGTLDASTYKLTDETIEFQALDDAQTTRLINRKGVKVNVNSVETIEGESLDANTDEISLTEVQFPLTANWTHPVRVYSAPQTVILDYDLIGTEFAEGQSPDPSGTGTDQAVFDTAVIDYSVATGSGGMYISGRLDYEYLIWANYQVTLQIRVNDGSTDVETHSKLLANTGNLNTDTFSFFLQNVTAGCSIYVEIIIPPAISTLWRINSGDLHLSGAGTVYSAIDIPAIGITDAFERVISIISGLDYQSDFFDVTGSNLAAIVVGVNLRGGQKDHSMSLIDLFKCAETLYNIALGYDGGKIRVEDLDFWFEETDGLDLSNRIEADQIEIEFNEDFFNSIKIGFSKFLLDYQTGLTEFNTKTEYSSVTNYEKEKALISPIRGDTTGMLKLRNNSLSSDATKTIEGDDDLFIISCHSVTGSKNTRDYNVKTDQGYDIAPTGWYNLDYAPGRILRKHYLREYIGASNLLVQSKDKTPDLISQETGGEVIDENANVNFDSFPAAKFKPEIITVNTYMTRAEIDSLDLKQRIVLSSEIKGWIQELIYNYKDNNTVTLKLIRSQ